MTTPGDRYTHGHHESVVRSHSWRTVDNSAAYLKPYLVPGATVLDVGCGPGTITLDIASRVYPARVVGLDASDEVIRRATALAIEREVSNVEFVTGNAYALDFADETFDIVHAHQVLQHVSRPVDLLREFRRVRTSTGAVGVREVDYGSSFWYPETEGLRNWLSTLSAVYRSNSAEPDAGRRLKAWARAAGFVDVVSTASIWTFNSDADREYWGGQWEERMLESTLALDALEAGLATTADLAAISRAWRDWVNDEDGWFAMPHGEIIAKG